MAAAIVDLLEVVHVGVVQLLFRVQGRQAPVADLRNQPDHAEDALQGPDEEQQQDDDQDAMRQSQARRQGQRWPHQVLLRAEQPVSVRTDDAL